MEYVNRNPKIFILSGKAKSGKNYVADIISDYYKNSIQISYAYYLIVRTFRGLSWFNSNIKTGNY